MYAVLISLSTALPALTVVPIAAALGWRVAIGCWFLIATSAAVPWIVVRDAARRARAADDPAGRELTPEPRLERSLVRSPLAWAVMVTFSLSSINVYAFFAWLPKLLVETAGVSAGEAGALLALYAIMGFPASLLVPYLASRMRNVGLLLYVALALILLGDGGLALAPSAAPVLWIVLAGLGPLLFPLSLVLINSRTRTHAGSVALSSFVQGIGYIIAAASPLAFGLLHQATGSWVPSLALLCVVTLAAIPAAIVLSRNRFLEDELRAG
jgi:CP family cyanate transporter-like MFS transporter